MAEERLIDDDKDKKYKIRKNADGEDELIIDESADETTEEESDIPVFEVPVEETDDEEAAVLTPEQFAERKKLREEAERQREERRLSHLTLAREGIAEGNFEAALYEANTAEEVSPFDGEVYCVKLIALTHGFTDFSSLDGCVEAADGVKEYADRKQRGELQPYAEGKKLKENISATREKAEKLKAENEGKKEERRQVFSAKKRRAVKLFACAAAPFAVLAALAIVFASMIFAAENGTYIALTAVFGGLAFVALVFVLITAHGLWDASRNCKLNERDSSTKLGRDYLQTEKVLEKLEKINSLFNL